MSKKTDADQQPGFLAKNWKMLVNAITILAFLMLVFFMKDEIASVMKDLERVNLGALMLMLPMQVLNYHSYSRFYQNVLGILHEKVRYLDMVKLQLELNFVNSVFPSGGVSGVSYFSLRMKAFSISTTKGTLTQVMKFALVFISFQVLVMIGLLVLAIAGKANDLTILVAGSLATLVVVGTFLMVYILQSRTRINSFLTFITKFLNRLIHFLRPKHPETINIRSAQVLFNELHENYLIMHKNFKQLKKPTYYALLANIAEVMTIYAVYLAFGEPVNIGAVIIAYAVANMAGLFSVLPGNVGIYEVIMTGVLVTAGVPAELAITVTIMYRVLNMILQLPLGYVFYHRAVVAGDGFKKTNEQ